MKNIAIVTGASSGIGKEFFLSLLDKELDEIWVVARREKELCALQELTKIPLRVFALDLSKENAVAPIKEALKEAETNIKYLICASGFGRFCAIEEDDPAVLENMVDLNCRAIVAMTAAAYPYLNEGSLVMTVGSLAGFQPIPYIATYGATKAFVVSYSRALNVELKKSKGARCLCVCPFWTKTAFFDRANAEKTVVKKFIAMYTPENIVKQAWKDVKKKRKDLSVYGFKAKGQSLLVKLFPHKFVMSVWCSQQGLK